MSDDERDYGNDDIDSQELLDDEVEIIEEEEDEKMELPGQ